VDQSALSVPAPCAAPNNCLIAPLSIPTLARAADAPNTSAATREQRGTEPGFAVFGSCVSLRIWARYGSATRSKTRRPATI